MWRNLVARQLWELKVVGSNPTIPTICPCDETGKRAGLRNQILWVRLPPRVLNWVVGRAGMQPPFKRIHPGSTPGRPTNSWAFGRTVMLLTLNQADTGSTPVAPTKFCPCNPSGRGAKLKIWKLLVQIQSGVLVNMRGWSNGGSSGS